MATRSVKVVLEAEVNKYLSNVKKAEQAASDAGAAAEAAGKKIDQAQGTAAKATDKSTDANKKHSESGKESAKGSEESAEASKKDAEYKARQRDAAEQAGGSLTKFGAVTVAALGASTKAAMDWESAWAGVTKTVDGTPEQMAEIESGLRGLSKTLPSTHEEIAGVAEAAGQLGVKRQDILTFTKTMVDLGETTNLTAEEAATDIAQIANVMGTHGDQIDNFGATLVALGNAGASTEKDILSMAQRIAGAGKLVGASEADVLALSNALASMGVKAELGGGVMTRVLLKMYSSVQGGGAKLDAFAKAAGTTAEDFAKKFSTSPVEALDMVTKGMGRVKGEGGNVVALMTEMGMKGTEEMQVMLSLAGAGDLLSESLALGSKAWEENTALLNEATKRYDTTESKVKVAWNNIKDAAIDAGAVMLPVISGIAENVSGLAQGFGQLPAPLQGAITGLGGVVGAAALAGGGLMLLLPKARDTIEAFKDLNTRADGSSRGLGKIGAAAGKAVGLLAGLEILRSIGNSMAGPTASTEEFTQSLIGLGKSKESLDDKFKSIATESFGLDVQNSGQALKKLIKGDWYDSLSSFNDTVLGLDNGMSRLRKGFESTDQAIAGAATSGNMDLAAQGFKAVADSAKDQGISLEEVGKKFPNYLDALRDQASQAKVTVSETDLLKWAMGEIPPAMQAAADGAGAVAEKLIDVKGASGQTIPITEDIAEALAEIGLSADGSIVSLDKFTEALLNTGLLQLSARDAARGWSQALLDLGLQADGTGGQVGKLGTAFDNTTEQGIKNQAMFDGVAQAGIRNVEAMAKNRASNEEVQGALKNTYDGLLSAAGQFGITGDAAVDLARDVLGVPDGISIDSWMSDEAKRMAQATTGELDKIDGRTVTARSVMIEETHRINYEKRVVESGGNEPEGGGLYGSDRRAGGGAIDGPGTSTSDEAGLFRLSKGEHVFDAADVQKMGGQQAVYRFRANLHGDSPGYAGGGAVGSAVASSQIMMMQTAPAPTVNLEGLTVNVTNPFTGEQVQGIVSTVARQEAAWALSGAARGATYQRGGAGR